MEVENVIIIGSGPAGYSAAIYTAREDFKPLMITGFQHGGQLMQTTLVENYPGFPDGILGPVLMEMFRKQAEKFGTRFISEDVTEVDFSAKPYKVKVGSSVYQTQTIILSPGASAKLLGLKSEMKLMGKGVSTCGTCDGPLYKNKNVVLVGGGDTAMEDAFFLTKFVKSITIIHRRNEFRASKIMQERVLKNEKVKVIWDSAVEEIVGDTKVRAVKIKNLKTNQVAELPIDGVFVAIGYAPNTKFLEGKLKTDELGYLVTKDEVKTDIEGVFVAGDVADKIYRQAATAAGSGVKAALEVRAYLQSLKYKTGKN